MDAKPGKSGVWFPVNGLAKADLIKLAQTVEQLNYDVLWYPESVGYESLAVGGFLLGETTRLCIASGIANIYARDAFSAMAGHNTLNALYGDRYVLGLGVSHVPLVEGRRGHVYGKPVSTMRAYLDAMAAAEIAVKSTARNIVLAALGPRMLALAREKSDGALPYNVPPEHTAQAKEILGPDRWLCVEQMICLTTDAATARRVAAQHLARYMAMPNYRNNWLRLGFSEEDLHGLGSDRFLDAIVAWGSAETIRRRLKEHFDAGATHVCLQPLNPDGSGIPDWNALQALSPEG
jgi:probable F420-dependent oxidoreductase